MRILGIGACALLAAAGTAGAANRVVLPTNVTPSHYDIQIVTDAAHMSFTGSVKIDVDAKQSANTIELNAADLAFTKVSLSGTTAAPKIAYDAKEETATLTFGQAFAAGHHVLAIDYRGKINQQAAGIFALDYDTPKGKTRALFTQFENSDARRFIPSWDEPNRKATFTLAATVPANLMAIANTPVASTESLPGGLKHVTFAQSPKMSSYLLFFGLGDFERVSRKVNGVDIGVIVKRGDTDKAGFALDAAAHILPYYEDYFGVKYPLPKLDLIGGPGQSQFFGAMENWGAIFYFERDLEIDAKLSTEQDRRNVYIVVAHEMAHQWFGDLVTMDWWDDLWLNEGFASWMEVKATDHFHPEWHVWLDSQDAKEAAMRVDGRAGTHPIVQPIHDVLQANEAFDTITYEKGQAVIRMLENYTGEDAFRAGVRNYIKAHAYGNTVTDDLWRELDKTSPRPVTKIAHDFTLQPGVPLIRAAAGPSGITLSEDRWAMDDSAKAPLSWQVPVLVGSWRGTVSRGAPVAVPAKPGAVVNDGQGSYFRTAYDPALTQALAKGFRGLSPENQLGLLSDSRALGYTGDEKLSGFLELASQADAAMNPRVLATLVGRLEGIDDLYRGLSGQAAYRAFARKLLAPVFVSVGWDAKPGEDSNITLLRADLLEALSQFDDPGVVTEAKKRFQAYLTHPAGIAADTRHTLLLIVARHADEAAWNALHDLAKKETSTLAKRELYSDLGLALDRKLADRALALVLTDEAAVTTRPGIIDSVAVNYPDAAFDFTLAHLALVDSWLEADSRNQYVPRLVSNSSDAKLIPKLNAFAAAHIPATARAETVRSASAIAFLAQVRDKRLPDVDKWLAAHPGK